MRSNLATVDSAAAQIPRERSAQDFYREPAWAVEALLNAERFVGLVWDPACGTGNILKACRRREMLTVGSDIVDRGYDDFAGMYNFATQTDALVDRVDNIICNPPFELAETFIKNGLGWATSKVAMLRRWALEEAPLSRVYVFASRVSMPPGDFQGDAKGGAVAFGWLVWDHDHRGPATFHRLHKPVGERA